MTEPNRVLHDLSDRLNGVTISVELASQLLGQDGNPDVRRLLQRVLEDCAACSQLIATLREHAG